MKLIFAQLIIYEHSFGNIIVCARARVCVCVCVCVCALFLLAITSRICKYSLKASQEIRDRFVKIKVCSNIVNHLQATILN